MSGEVAIRQMKERGFAAAEELSRSYGVDGFASDLFHRDESLLSLAVQSGNLQAVKWLLDHGARVDGHDGRGLPLWFAAFHKDLAAARLLLARGAKPKNVQGRVRMIEPAVKAGSMELARLLIDNGSVVDYDLVVLSCTDSPLTMTKYLLSKVEVSPYWMTRCLDSALQKEKFETAMFFLKEKNTPVSDATLFITLAALGRNAAGLPPQLMRVVTERMTHIDTLDTSVFHYSMREKEAFNFEDKTALMIAAYHNRIDALRLIIARRPDVNLKTPRRKYTALHYAVIRCHQEAIDFLLAGGAQPNAQDIFEKAPLNYALENCPGAIVARLERAGAEKTILTRGTTRDIRHILFHYGIPIAYSIFAVAMREGVYRENSGDNWFGRVNGPLASAFLLGPLPAFILVQSKTMGLLGAILAPYVAVIGGIAGLTLGIVCNDRFNDNRGIYYASVVPIYSFTFAQFFF